MASQVDFQKPKQRQLEGLQQKQPAEEPKRLCKEHPYAECEFLLTDPTNTTQCPFKCVMCLFEQSLNTKHLIPIKQFQHCDENTILWNWPLPDNAALLQRVKEVTTSPKTDIRFRDQIGEYFKELRAKINEKINEMEKVMLKQAESLWNFNAHIASEYNRMSAKEILKRDVFDLQTDPDELAIKIRETIAAVLRGQEQTERALQRELEEHSLQMSIVDYEGPKRIMATVLEQLGKISIFIVDDVRDIARQHNPDNDLGDGNTASLFELATCKLNGVSTEYQSCLKSHLSRLQRVIDKAEFGSVYEEGKKRLQLELLGEQELNQVFHFTESLINNKKNLLQSNNKAWSSDIILELVKNPANQCTPGILNQLQEVLKNINCYFQQFNIAEPLLDPIDLTKLSSVQLQNIDALAKKMTQLSLVPDLNYPTAVSPIAQLQFNSAQSLSYLEKEFVFTKEQSVEVSRVLTQLPILELLPFRFGEMQLNLPFIKTNYSSSNQLEITDIQNGCLINQKQSLSAQAVSANNLQNELTYELTCRFNRPLDCSYIIIGLIPEDKIHLNYIGGNNDSKTVFYSNNTGANTIIKGSQLSQYPLKERLLLIKFRFCIQSQQLFIFDESGQNIVKADPTQINSNGKYRFGIYFCTPGADYSVAVCNLKASKNKLGIDSF